MACLVKRAADLADAAVHHVRRRDDLTARIRLANRLLAKDGDGFVVGNLPVAKHAVMAVAGIGIKRHIADDAEIRACFLDRADRPADKVVGVEGKGAVFILQ